MAFDINIWRELYDRINAIGSVVKINNRARHNREHYEFGMTDIENMTKAASNICADATNYMNDNGILASIPKWQYLSEDETTHASSPKFVYSHLLK